MIARVRSTDNGSTALFLLVHCEAWMVKQQTYAADPAAGPDMSKAWDRGPA
jgi:hypothetical protein